MRTTFFPLAIAARSRQHALAAALRRYVQPSPAARAAAVCARLIDRLQRGVR